MVTRVHQSSSDHLPLRLSESNNKMMLKRSDVVADEPEMNKLQPLCCCTASTGSSSSPEVSKALPPPKSRSGSLLDMLKIGRRRRRSSCTKTLDCRSEEFTATTDGLTCSTRSQEQFEDPPRIPGGCLKVTTQHKSLCLSYGELSSKAQEEEQPQDHHNKVSFGSIDLLVFPLALGDNPSVSVGPPICCGEKLHTRFTVSVDDYEASRPEIRHRESLHVPRMVREDWLRDEGYSRSELRETEEMLLAIKKSRKANASSGFDSNFFVRLFHNKNKRASALKVDK